MKHPPQLVPQNAILAHGKPSSETTKPYLLRHVNNTGTVVM